MDQEAWPPISKKLSLLSISLTYFLYHQIKVDEPFLRTTANFCIPTQLDFG